MDQNPEGQGQKSAVGNNQPSPPANTPPGAIFSSGVPTSTSATPPVSPPNQPTTDPTMSEASRQFFANHPAHTFSREMGDIVIGGTSQPKKKHKVGLIVGIMLFIIALIAAVIIIVILNRPVSREDIVQSFSNYQTSLNTPPVVDGQAVTDQAWSLFNLLGSNLTLTTKAEYIANIRAAYDNFADQAARVQDSPTLAAQLPQYQALLNVSLNYASQDVLQSNLLDAYLQEGTTGAEAYLNSLKLDESGTELTNNVATNLAAYLSLEIELFELYQSNNCLTGNTIDYACAVSLEETSSAYTEIIAEQNLYGASLNNIAYTLENALFGETANLEIIVKGASE